MSVSDDLRRCGFEPANDPPVVTVAMGGSTARVRVEEVDWRVVLRAEVPALGAVDPTAAATATLGAAGDTSLEAAGTTIVATRTLVEPSPAALRDAIFDLAKAASVLAAGGAAATAATAVTAEPVTPMPPVASAPAAPAVAAVPPAGAGDFWFYVDTEQQLVSGSAASQVVGVLRPGQWYQGQGEEAGWVRATDERGVQGWIAAAAVHRDG